MEKKTYSRRGFLGLGALSAAGVAAGGLLGCSPQVASESTADAEQAAGGVSSAASWTVAPAPVVDSDIAETIETDVVVVGGGNAGLFAACAAAEEGAKVVLLEKIGELGTTAREWIGAIGSSAQQAAGVDVDKLEVVEELCFYASHRCNQRLIKLWADNSGATVDWLEGVVKEQNPDAYIHIETDTGNPDHGIYKTYPIQHNVQTDTEKLLSLSFVAKKAEELGVEIMLNTPMEQLIREDDGAGRVSGVIANNKEKGAIRVNARKGVIICTGGYCGNEEMMREENEMVVKYCTAMEAPPNQNMGDGIKAAVWVGAKKQDQATAMVFDRGGVPAGVPGGGCYENPGVMTHIGSQPFLKVNHAGERFCNESVPYDFIYAAGTYEPLGTYCEIWDANWVEQTREFHTLGCSRIQYSPTGGKLMLFDEEATAGFHQEVLMPAGIVVESDTLEGLAEALQIPADTFVATVERYNELCAKGKDEDFGKESYRMLPLTTPPYRASTLGGQLLCTLDGLEINTDLQVLDANLEPIPGLYAAGNDSGGFFANNYPELIIGSACGRTLTFGRLAGQNVAKAL